MGYEMLALPLQKILWQKQWKSLRQIQIDSIKLIIDGHRDVIISANTAAGKSEAAFLPLLTRLWERNGKGILLYIAPLKALINDQYERLKDFCDPMDIPVYPWHGDVSGSVKCLFFEEPRGVLLITPESLEALLFSRGYEFRAYFRKLDSIVVDELHYFIGTERGKQVQSLMHRVECLVGRNIPRIGISATLGDMRLASNFLRPKHGHDVSIVVGDFEKRSIKLSVRAKLCSVGSCDQAVHRLISDELFNRLTDGNYLIFPNTVLLVELYSDLLRQNCEERNLPLRFYPHHGRLAKSEREFIETSLKQGAMPISAICTSTLELGIDIGPIRGVVQIGAPNTVSSLCQRIGRAGRREGESAIYLQYCIVHDFSGHDLSDLFSCSDLLQSIAVINLLINKWFEPPAPDDMHCSTFIQQFLSLVGERHGLLLPDGYSILCKDGPFDSISEDDYVELINLMVDHDLIMQDATGLVLHGSAGEKRVNHYSFFAAFNDSVSYQLFHSGKFLGTLPLVTSFDVGDPLIFMGQRWSIVSVDHEKKYIGLSPSAIGSPPRHRSSSLPLHDAVRNEMQCLLNSKFFPKWLDSNAELYLHKARRCFYSLGLDRDIVVKVDDRFFIFLWRGDRIQDALVMLLETRNLHAINHGICIELQCVSMSVFYDSIFEIISSPYLNADELLSKVGRVNSQKWDRVLSDKMYFKNYASARLDVEGAYAACSCILSDFNTKNNASCERENIKQPLI